VNRGAAAVRAADVLLRCAGGRSVLLRMPANASAGDTTEQLGLAVPEFQDVELAPVVFRKARQAASALTVAVDKATRWELMVFGDGGGRRWWGRWDIRLRACCLRGRSECWLMAC